MTAWYDTLLFHARTVHSQTGEDGILEEIFHRIGTTDRYLVDLGAGDGQTLSNTQYLIEQGWHGTRVDLDTHGQTDLCQAVITADNIQALLQQHHVPTHFDLLSLDLDGNDWYVLRAVLRDYHPRVLVCEINGQLPANPPRTIVYNPDHRFENCNYYGASLGAFTQLAQHHGLQLIYVHAGLNAFFIEQQHLPPDYRPNLDFRPNLYWGPDPHHRPWHTIEPQDLP
jgi:hypothetical protein